VVSRQERTVGFIFVVGGRKERRDKTRCKVEEVTRGGKQGLIFQAQVEGLFSAFRFVGTVTFRPFDG